MYSLLFIIYIFHGIIILYSHDIKLLTQYKVINKTHNLYNLNKSYKLHRVEIDDYDYK
jgi:hypothetical protein